MSSTPRPPFTPDDRAFFQRIINLYHRRLIAAWKCVTGGTEAVPDSHIEPPSIADWSNDKIHKALQNFRNHLKWFEAVELNEATRNLNAVEWLALYYAFRFLNTDPPVVSPEMMILERGQCEPYMTRWDNCPYPELKYRWDRLADENKKKPTRRRNKRKV
ncbi:hypothetical protein EDC01DRAFT_634573 [Geopyxis carbonaria]|nr:hypothetical protein EDC01DRAFT_634573 [Geopyxis carbonaria]